MKKIPLLSTALLASSGLFACAPQSTPAISLYRQDSRLVMLSMSGEGSAPLPTYRHKDHGDVPFANLEELIPAFIATETLGNAKFSKIADHTYALSCYNTIIALFYPESDQVVFKKPDQIDVMGNANNHGIFMDTCSPNDDPKSALHTSPKSVQYGESKDIVYDLKKYNMPIEEIDGKVYMPVQTFATLFFPNTTYDFVYNGLDFFYSVALGGQVSVMMPGAYSSCYASEGTFAFGSLLFTPANPVGEEKYRFVASEEGEGQSIMRIFSFAPDGKIAVKEGTSPSDPGQEAAPGAMSFTYEEKTDGIYVTCKVQLDQELVSTFKIPNEKSYFGAGTRSEAAAKFSYDLLRLNYENFYGLRKELFAKYNVDSLEALVTSKNLKDKLLSTDSTVYDNALCEFLLTYVDDCHTKYTARSIYSGLPTKDVDKITEGKVGPRRTSVGERINEYGALRTARMTADDPVYTDTSKQIGLFLEDETAVIRFDTFTHMTALISNVLDPDFDINEDPAMAMALSSPDGFYSSFQQIAKHPEIKNVVIDLTCNTGGAAVTLPYLAAHWTDDPTFTLYDTKSEVYKEYHYSVDLNRNGIFGEPEDTYKDKYNFYLLTSDLSFSCGNALPTMAHVDGVKIIGKQSAGGACPVATFSDGSGTIYNTSMPVQISYKDASGNYINNDAGIPVDYPLDKDSWYDLPKLNAFVKNLDN